MTVIDGDAVLKMLRERAEDPCTPALGAEWCLDIADAIEQMPELNIGDVIRACRAYSKILENRLAAAEARVAELEKEIAERDAADAEFERSMRS